MKGDDLARLTTQMKAIIGVDGGALFFGRAKDLRLLFSIQDGSVAETMVKIERTDAVTLRDWLDSELARR